MPTIKQIFDEISAESGTNKKMEILSKYKNNDLLKRVLYLANSRRVKFYIKQIPEYTTVKEPVLLIDEALDKLDYFIKRQKTGSIAIEFLKTLLSNLTPDYAYILIRIIEKDCKIGMGTTNMNKVFGDDFIEDTPYMGAMSFSPEKTKKVFVKGYAYSQIKMDGRYANAIVCDGAVELESRAGEITRIGGSKCLEELSKFKNCVLNGELTMNLPKTKPDGTLKSGTELRYESNGLIASLVSIGNKIEEGKDVSKEISKFKKEQGYEYQESLDMIQYTIWDMITLEEYAATKSSTKYHVRLQNVKDIIKETNPTRIVLIESTLVKCYEDALAHFGEVLKDGLEGTILKSEFGEWKDGKPNWQIKMKLEMDVDMRIIGFNYGSKGTKNEHVISSITVESSDGLVVTRAQGLKEPMMKYVTANQDKLMGMILEVKSCGLSNDSTGAYSLLHPVFKTIRDDKTTCDTLESIKSIESMMKGLKSI